MRAARNGAAIIFSAGFAETGPHGLAEQERLAQIAREHNMIIEGPNCLGMVNGVDGIPLTFVLTPPAKLKEERGLAVVSQSGAMAAVLGVSLRKHGIGISFSISTGNEAVTGVEDYVEYLIGDGAESFDTNGLHFQKLSSDLFRAALGFGSGDLKVTAAGNQALTTEIPNVIFADRKVQAIEKLIAVKPDRAC